MAERIHTALIGMGMKSKIQSAMEHQKPFEKRFHPKAQSAMEYLMTYGWAILVIAVVLGVLYSIGIFNPSNFAPKAQPGSCQVFRPNGPGTSYDLNLEGTCNGELPQYTAQFNGANSYIRTDTARFPTGASPNSVFAWIYVTGSEQNPIILSYGTDGTAGEESVLYVGNNPPYLLLWYNGATQYNGASITENIWHFVGYTYTGGNSLTIYLDGQSTPVSIVQQNIVLPASNPSAIGAWGSRSIPIQSFKGNIANVQLYNTSISSNSVKALYQEGIGGTPIDPQHLVGWWPLNGNANDYSGNNNNGVPSNVIFTGSWASGYTAP
jgi:hypothetical protein